MPQLVKKRRSGWAVLAAGALVASLFAVGAAPAAAQSLAPRPDHSPGVTPNWDACVGDAGRGGSFPDVNEDNVHAAAINCIAYYGITLGKDDGTYAPDEHVKDHQMRRFVMRAADLMDADGEAVLAKVELSNPVERVEMAALMFHLLDDLLDWARVNSRTGNIEFDRDGNSTWTLADDFFADVRATEPNFESQMVGAAYELGVVRGRSDDVSTADSVFAPRDPVTRAQMASFITRALDHSNLRPEGLVVQRNLNKETMISYRDGDFMPIANARVDVFSALYVADAFDDDDGECEFRFVKDETPSHRACEIDIGDEYTDDQGNIELTLASDSDPLQAECSAGSGKLTFKTAVGTATDRTHWAWTGPMREEVDEDTRLIELQDVNRPMSGNPPTHAHITGGLPTDDELAKMGETVTFTVQLQDASNNPARPDRSANPYHLRIERYYVARVADTELDAEDAAVASTQIGTADGVDHFREVPGNWNYVTSTRTVVQPTNRELVTDARLQTPVDTLVYPNADGELTITLTTVDLQSAVDNVDVGVQFKLTPFLQENDRIPINLVRTITAADPGVVWPYANYAEGNAITATPSTSKPAAIGYVIFSDDKAVPYKVTADSIQPYRFVGSSNSVTVKVINQYGDPMVNQNVVAVSDLDGTGNLTSGATINSTTGEITPGTRNDEIEAPETDDRVLYPEEMDITVQETEDRFQRDLDLSYDSDANGTEDDDDDENPGEGGDDTFTVASGVPVLVTERNGTIDSDDNTQGAQLPTADGLSSAVESDLRPDNDGTYDIQNEVARSPLKTRRDGTRRIGYRHIGEDGETEMITGYVLVAGDNPATSTTETSYYLASDEKAKVYWAEAGTSMKTPASVTGGQAKVLVADVASRAIVVNEGPNNVDNPRVYFYDEDDTFVVEDVGATFDMFEEALSATYATRGAKPNTVNWRNYTLGLTSDRARPGTVDRTVWELSLICKPAS